MTGPELKKLRKAAKPPKVRSDRGPKPPHPSQAELAEAVGVDRQTVSRWERDKLPIPTTAERLILILLK